MNGLKNLKLEIQNLKISTFGKIQLMGESRQTGNQNLVEMLGNGVKIEDNTIYIYLMLLKLT